MINLSEDSQDSRGDLNWALFECESQANMLSDVVQCGKQVSALLWNYAAFIFRVAEVLTYLPDCTMSHPKRL